MHHRVRAAPAQDGSIALGCTVAEIAELEPLRRMAYLRLGEHPEEDPDSDVGIEDISVAPSSVWGAMGSPRAPPQVSSQRQ
jgi:hypothetical protein